MAQNNQTTIPVSIISSDDEMRESECFKDSSLVELVSILPCRLQLAIMTKKPKFEENCNFYVFSTDERLLYANFYEDFGPLNLAKLYRYCNFLNNVLQQETRETKTIIHYTRKDPRKILNAAFLIGCYSLIYLRFNVQTVMKALGPILKHANSAKFCDASINDLAYLSLKDCLSGVFKAIQRNFFNFEDFNVDDYEYYECVENGDMNWIVPGKLLAFCGPSSRTERTSDTILLGPEFYIEYFQTHNVTVVVRLNSPKYDAHAFTKAGIQHFDLYFSDGSTPSERLAKQFLKICENARGAVAVHCKAGLGRTGTLIGAYLIKHYRFSAMESIGWLRICRPGSVIGQQQAWLNSKQSQLLQEGELYRQQRQHLTYPPEKHARGVYSLQVGMENDDTPNTKTANLKPTTGHTIESENVQGIAQRVDTMCLNDEDEQDSARLDVASQVNNNVVHCKPNRIKKVSKLTSRYIRGNRLNGGRTIVTTTTTTTTTIRRGRGNANVPPLGGTQQRASLQETHVSRKKTTVTSRQMVPGRTETLSAPAVRNQRNASVQTASQGDQLNSIKAARRHHVPTDTIQQKTTSSKVIQSPTSTNTNPSERNIKLTTNVADKDKDGTLATRNETAKNNNPAEGGTIQNHRRNIRLQIVKYPPNVRYRSAHTAPTSYEEVLRDIPSQDTDKCVPATNTRVTRTMKKNLPADGSNSQSTSLPTQKRYRFATTVTTIVTQGKKLSFEISLNLMRLLSSLLAGTSSMLNSTKMKKGKTYETFLQIDPKTSNDPTDVYTFTVRINMADLFSGETADLQSYTGGNIFKHIKNTKPPSALYGAETIKSSPQEQRTAIKSSVKYLKAKLTWLVEEKNRFTFRVTFDLEALNNLISLPAYMYDQKGLAACEIEREFETIITGGRESELGSSVSFEVKLDLLQVLAKPKMIGTIPPEAASQSCPSNEFEGCGVVSCPGFYDLRLHLDHNGNDPSATTQHDKEMLDKPKMQGALSPSQAWGNPKNAAQILAKSKAASQPCPSSATFDTSMSSPSELELKKDINRALLVLDQHVNNSSEITQHGKQQTPTPRTTSTNAETDTRPYKRLRVDLSRP